MLMSWMRSVGYVGHTKYSWRDVNVAAFVNNTILCI